MTFLFSTIRNVFFVIWYDSYLGVTFKPSIFSFVYTRTTSVKNIFIRGHLGLFDARLVPYGGIWVFMRIGFGIVFVIVIDIFDRLDFFDCQKSDYKNNHWT